MAVLAPRISLCDTVSFSLQWVGAIGHRRFHWAEMYAILREVQPITVLEKRVDEGCDGGTRCEYYQAAQHNKAKDDRQKPEFFSLFHERPKLQKKFAHT